jgi:glycosidase
MNDEYFSFHESEPRRSTLEQSRAIRAATLLLATMLVACGGGSSGGGGGGDSGSGGGGGGGGGTPPPATSVDFRDEIVYQLLTDRFDNGDERNDSGTLSRPADQIDVTNPVGWHGGDFAGIRRRIEDGYFARLGVTALWISPVVLQVPPPGSGGGVNAGKPFVGFHGYWADTFDAIEPHFGDVAALRSLGAAADAAGLKLVIDVVVNHTGPQSRVLAQNPTWFRTGPQCGNTDVTLCLAGLPDFRQEQTQVTPFLLDTISYLQTTVPTLDGLRMDTMKHVGDAFWRDFFAATSPAVPTKLWTVGEVFSSDVAQIAHYLDTVGSPSVFDFPLRFALLDSFARGGSTRRVAELFARDSSYADPTRLTTFIDNHDVWRFVSEAEAAGASASDANRRLDMALSMIYLARGIPTVYYGTEIAMRGRGDSYDLPIGASSREDMDFTRLATSTVDERMKALGDARKQYRALRRGQQRTLFSPRSNCTPPNSSFDPAADYGDRLFVRGGFDGWANPPPPAQAFVNLGGRQYEAAVELPAGRQEFKVAAADWLPEFSNPTRDTVLGLPITLGANPGSGTNSRINVSIAGCHAFVLDASSLANPVLTVNSRVSAVADPDVLVLARTLDGDKSVVAVFNNQRTAVELASVNGGIDVQGLLPDGTPQEITGAGTELRVAGGKLAGTMPALSVRALAAP